MKKGTLAALAMFSLPLFAFAQQTIANYIIVFGNFINNKLIPFMLALALIFFLWNAMRFFILGGAKPAEQEKARSLALWAILAFVLIVSTWGLVNLLVSGLNLGRSNPICPDYNPNC